MGQATMDLHDALETPLAPTASADDLLSQMAGAEIDRLLAEADSSPDSIGGTGVSPVDEVPAQVSANDIEKPITAGQPAVPSGDPIDELLSELTSPEKPTLPTAEISAVAEQSGGAIGDPAAAVKALDDALAKHATASHESTAADLETSPAEKNALAQVVEAVENISDDQQNAEQETGKAPFYLRPLVWLNAPFGFLPAALHEAMGKIAILTLVNAIAVFTYVLFFRRHR